MRRPLCITLLLLASLLAGPGPRESLALDPRQSVTQYAHDAWQARSVLPQERIEAILQTRDGYLWLGTKSGLVRFDGVRPTVFDRGNTPALHENRVVSLFEDPRGGLWVGTDGGGLARLEGGSFRAFTTDEGLSQNYVRAVVETPGGDIWVGTGGGGLNRFRDGRFERLPGIPGNVRALLVDRRGTLWIGTAGAGLIALDPVRRSLRAFGRGDGLPDDHVMAIAGDREGDVWIGTRAGLTRVREGRLETWGTGRGLSHEAVRCLLEDRDGNLWIGTLGGGLNRMTDGHLTAFGTAEGLSDDQVFSLHEDREGSLWIGTGKGLDRLKNSRVTWFGRREGLSLEDVRTVSASRDGSVWAATDGGGLNRIRGGRVDRVLTRRGGLPADYVLSALEAQDGTLWVATAGGVTALRDGGARTFSRADGLVEATVSAMAETRDGLIVADGAVVRVLRGGRFEPLWSAAPPPLKHVYAMHPAPDGTVWLGTAAGLAEARDGRYRLYTRGDGLPHDTVHAIHEDADGTLWLATRGGLARFRSGRAAAITAADGLCDNVVFQILPDDRGRLWMSTSRGVCVVEAADLARFAAGERQRLTSILLDRSDGMKTVEYVAVTQPAGCRTADGRLWFPTTGGVASLDPRRWERNPVPPPVHVEAVSVDGRPLPGGSMVVPAGSERVEIRYTALSLRSPERVRFRYRLEGYDSGWNDAGTRRSVEYTGLPPGSFLFRVGAANDDGLWNEEGAAVALRVLPRFHQAWWFPLLVLGAAAGLVYAAHHARMRRREAEIFAVMEERRRIAREMHDTLIQGIVGVSTQLEVASMLLGQGSDRARAQIDRVRHLVRDSLDEARRALFDLRTDGWAGHNLERTLRRVAESVPAPPRVELRVSPAAAAVTGRLRVAAGRIAQEALANAVRHAAAAVVTIDADTDGTRLRLVVRDDGRGFDASAPAPGADGHFGLVGMRERAGRVGGEVTIRSEPGRGTEVVLEAPLPVPSPERGTIEG